MFHKGQVELGEPNVMTCYVGKFWPPVISVAEERSNSPTPQILPQPLSASESPPSTQHPLEHVWDQPWPHLPRWPWARLGTGMWGDPTAPPAPSQHWGHWGGALGHLLCVARVLPLLPH